MQRFNLSVFFGVVLTGLGVMSSAYADDSSTEQNRKKVQQLLSQTEQYQTEQFSHMSVYDKAMYNAYNGLSKSYSASFDISDEEYSKLTESQKKSIENTRRNMESMNQEISKLVIPKY